MPLLKQAWITGEPTAQKCAGLEKMKRGDDNIFISFAASVLLHICILMCSAFPQNYPAPEIVPALQSGESALTLTFLSVRQSDEPLPHEPEAETICPPDIQPEPQPVEPVLAPENMPASPDHHIERRAKSSLEKEKQREPEPRGTADSDLLTKGVRADALPASEIRPHYPIGSRVRGEQGTVALDISVVPPGRALEVNVVRSSGYSSLDMAAVKAVKSARFVTADRKPISAETRTALVFRFQLVD